MKKLIFCFDGTTNKIDGDEATNVLLLSAAIANHDKGTPQIIYYEEGVGNPVGRNAVDKVRETVGAATGKGLYDKIKEAYEFLCFNYVKGDQIFVFGFSRGAYTARSFCGFVQHNGIMKRARIEKVIDADNSYRKRDMSVSETADDRKSRYDDRVRYAQPVCCSIEEQQFRAKRHNALPGDFPLIEIAYLGVWDTVKTLTSGDEKDHDFHIDDIGEIVKSARHAVAIDEHRKGFDVTLINNIDEANLRAWEQISLPNISKKQYRSWAYRKFQEHWFPGEHGSVGGGGDIRGLSDGAFLWILEGAKQAGLKVDTTEISRVFDLKPDPRAPLDNTLADGLQEKVWKIIERVEDFDRVGPNHMYEVSRSTLLRLAHSQHDTDTDDIYDPGALRTVWSELLIEASKFDQDDFDLCLDYADSETKPETMRNVNGKEYYIYRIQRGDTLNEIADDFMGSQSFAEAIFQANKIMVIEPAQIQAGQLINIPVNEHLKSKLSK